MRRGLLVSAICAAVFNCHTTWAYEYSEEYKQCVSVPNLSKEAEFYCLREENMNLLRKLETTKQLLISQGKFSDLAASGNTLDKQLDNWKKYVNSYCQYSMEGECPDYRTPKINKEECIYSFMATLAEDWENMLKDIQK